MGPWRLRAERIGLGEPSVLLIRFADGRSHVLDGYSYAPAAASPRTIGAEQQRRGYRSSTVPSTLAVLRHALEKYGALTRERVMAPAIRIAEKGFAVMPLLHCQICWLSSCPATVLAAAGPRRDGTACVRQSAA